MWKTQKIYTNTATNDDDEERHFQRAQKIFALQF